MGDFQRVENRLAKKADLALIGEAKRKATEGRPSKETVVNIDNSLPKHNTRTELAKTAGVSTGNVYKVEKILEQASPELLTAVRAGEVTINLASQLATLPKEKVISERAKANQLSGLKQYSDNDTVLTNSSKRIDPINTRKVIADTAGVAQDTVAKVKAIESTGSDELKQAVRAGDVTINLASHHKLTLYLARNRPLLPRYRMQNEKGTPKRIAARVTRSAHIDNFHILKFD